MFLVGFQWVNSLCDFNRKPAAQDVLKAQAEEKAPAEEKKPEGGWVVNGSLPKSKNNNERQ